MNKLCTLGCGLASLTLLGTALAKPATAASLYSITKLDAAIAFQDTVSNAGQLIANGKQINKQGQRIEGRYLFTGNQITDLGNLPNGYFGDTSTHAQAINDLGQVVGDSGGDGFFWTPSTGIQRISGQGGFSSVWDINNRGQLVGTSGSPGTRYSSFTYNLNTKTFQIIPAPFSVEAFAQGINEQGQIVGSSKTDYSDGVNTHAFLYDQATLTDLNSQIPSNSGWILEGAVDINDRGQIIGTGRYQGEESGFLLTPVAAPPEPKPIPEPSATGALIWIAIVTLLPLRRGLFGGRKKTENS